MRIGVVFPTFEIGNDAGLIREFGEVADDLGYSHIVVFDHVLGAHPVRPEWPPRADGSQFAYHTHVNPVHEPMVLMGFLAGATKRIGFMTAVLVLPQRQTALVAKQAAQLAVLRPKGLRLGVGTGWNFVEYDALGVDFKIRGKIIDEQVELMRNLWANDLVEFKGTYHRVANAGLNPRPEETIPIWFGGTSDAAIQRCARVGDGWIPLLGPGDSLAELRDRLYTYAEAYERYPSEIGIEVFVNFLPGSQYELHKKPNSNLVVSSDPDRWQAKLDELERFGGITHVSLLTMDYGLTAPRDHLRAIQMYAEVIDLRHYNELN